MRAAVVAAAVLALASGAAAFLTPTTPLPTFLHCPQVPQARPNRGQSPPAARLGGGEALWRRAWGARPRPGVGRFLPGGRAAEEGAGRMGSTVQRRTLRTQAPPKGGARSWVKQALVGFLELLRDIYGQFMVLFMDTFIQKPFLHILNRVEISNHKALTDLISKRPRGTPLITVSNHCSSLDEPLLFSAIIPWPIKQWQLRYSLCNDNMFFVFGPVFAQLFFYAARGFPIWRSRSINQPSFKKFCNKARDGGWCHIFPEGRIWQPWKLQAKSRRLGDLRPGVGKLVANCEESKAPPVVLPFYHTGMHRVLPQFPNSKLQSMPPKIGNTIRIRMGEPIDMSDLLEKHRAARAEARSAQGITDGWTSTDADQVLYDEITQRVEAALVELGNQVDVEEEWQTHPSVLPGANQKK